MIWLHTLGESHITQLQGLIGHFSGEFIQLKIWFEPGVRSKQNIFIPKCSIHEQKLRNMKLFRNIHIFKKNI